jgi:hypothetical protein
MSLKFLFPITVTLAASGPIHPFPGVKARLHIEGVPGGKVSILGGHNIGHTKHKIVRILFRTVSEIELFHYTVHCTVQRINTPCPHTSCIMN